MKKRIDFTPKKKNKSHSTLGEKLFLASALLFTFFIITISSQQDFDFKESTASFGQSLSFFSALKDLDLTPSLTGASIFELTPLTTQASISACSVVNTAGPYLLTQNIGTGGYCLNITTSHVLIDCQGFNITYGGHSVGNGVDFQGEIGNVTIKNCYFFQNLSLAGSGNIGSSIALSQSFNNTFFNNTFYTQTDKGTIFLRVVNNTNISWNAFRHKCGLFSSNSSVFDIQDMYNGYIDSNIINTTCEGDSTGAISYTTSSYSNQNVSIRGNTINTTGTSSIALNLKGFTTGTFIEDNIVKMYGNKSTIMALKTSSNILIRSNTFQATHPDASTGIQLNSGPGGFSVNNSLFDNNIIETSGSLTPLGFGVSNGALTIGTNIFNNVFVNNNLSAPNGIWEIRENGDTNVNYFIYNNSWGEIAWQNNGTGGFLQNSTLFVNGTLALDQTIFIGNNTAAVNTSAFTPQQIINNSANITLYGLDLVTVGQIAKVHNFTTNNTEIRSAGFDCNQTGSCGILSYEVINSGGKLLFNTTSLGSFSGNLSAVGADTIPPRFNPFPTNQTIEANTTFVYDFNATDETSIVTYGVNDSVFNINSTGGLVNSSPLQFRTYVLNITINDTSNNKNFTYFQVAVVDTTLPRFDPFPTNQTIEANTTFVYDFNATDLVSLVTFGVNDSVFNINSTGGLVNSSPLQFRTYVLNITINDTSNNKNFTYFQINIQDTTLPRFDPFPTNQTIEANTTFVYDFNATDLVSLVTFGVNDSVFNINSTGGLVNSSPLQFRTYVLNITINDTLNNKNFTYFQVAVVDTTLPRFDPLPTNQTLESENSFSYDINGTDLVSLVTFGINDSNFNINSTGGITNISFFTSVGTYIFNLTVNDTSNNKNSTFFQLVIVDTTVPRFSPIPTNQTIEANTSFIYDINATDAFLANYSINYTSLFVINSSGAITNISPNLALGVYNFNISINDTSNNRNGTFFRVTVQDTISPRFDPFPVNQTIEANTTFFYDFNATDLASLVTFGVNDSVFNINSTGGLVNSSPLQFRTYVLNITINDTSNNKNFTYFQVAVVDTTLPRFDPLPTNQTIEYGAQFEYDINATDNIGISNFTINYTSGFAINNTGGLRNISTLVAGTYYFNISINDTSNNVNWTFFQFIMSAQPDSGSSSSSSSGGGSSSSQTAAPTTSASEAQNPTQTPDAIKAPAPEASPATEGPTPTPTSTEPSPTTGATTTDQIPSGTKPFATNFAGMAFFPNAKGTLSKINQQISSSFNAITSKIIKTTGLTSTSLLSIIIFITLLTLGIYNMPTINRTIFGKSTILIDRGINTKTPVMIDTITKTITQKAQPSQPPPQLPLKQKSSSPELKKATYDEELYTIKEQIQQIRQQQSAPIKPTTSSSRTISKVSSTLDHELRDLDNHLQGYSQSSKIITETPATKAKWDKSLQEIENQLQNIEQPFQNKSIIKTTIHNHYSNRISEDKNTLYKNLKWINTKLKSPEQKNTPLQYSLKTITPTISTLSTPTTSLKIEPTNTTSKTKIINSHSSKQKKDYTKELSAIEETLHQIR